jgi:hypothetical protein
LTFSAPTSGARTSSTWPVPQLSQVARNQYVAAQPTTTYPPLAKIALAVAPPMAPHPPVMMNAEDLSTAHRPRWFTHHSPLLSSFMLLYEWLLTLTNGRYVWTGFASLYDFDSSPSLADIGYQPRCSGVFSAAADFLHDTLRAGRPPFHGFLFTPRFSSSCLTSSYCPSTDCTTVLYTRYRHATQ